MSDHVLIFEMSPRDGLQNEKRDVSTAQKIELVNLLSVTGLTKIETASFVSPKWVPQMADSGAVMAGITRHKGVKYTALTPNMQGFERAKDAQADEIAVFGSASESFSQKNINCSIAESLDRFRPVVAAARAAVIPVRGYVSCVTDCPYEGRVSPEAVARVAAELYDMGCYAVSLGDTIGQGEPDRVTAMFKAVLDRVPVSDIGGHFHDTNGRALDNIRAALALGIRVFDASAGGLGGCPFAPGAAGNVATEDVSAMLATEGLTTGIDPDALAVAARFARKLKDG